MARTSHSRLSPEVIVPLLGLVYVGLLFLYLTATLFYLTQTNPSFYAIPVFGVVYLVLAFLIWRRNKFGYAASVVVSLLFIFVFVGQVETALSGFANIPEFVDGITAVPALILVFVYSIVGARSLWRKNPASSQGRSIPLSSVLALVTVGFVAGAGAIGVIAGDDIARIASGSNAKADVIIVEGASNPGIAAPFAPANYTITVGSTVVWLNKDTATHTVTSASVPNGATSFDSGNLVSGQSFSWTFMKAGVYSYYCSLHPFMKGTIMVVGG